MKLCKDCAHFSRASPYNSIAGYCDAPLVNRSVVYGGSIEPVEDARFNQARCGIDAVWFSPKPIKVSWFKRLFERG